MEKTLPTQRVDPRHEIDGKYSWILCICCWAVLFVNYGLLKCTGVIFVNLYRTFDMSKSDAASITIITFGTTFGSAAFGSAMIKCIGYRRSLFFGVTCGFFGLFSSYFAKSPALLSLTLGALLGIGAGISNITMISLVTQYFKVHLAKATGIAFTGSGIGGIVLPPLTEYIVTMYGLQGAFLLLSGLVLHLYIVAFIAIDPPKRIYTSDHNNAEERSGNLVGSSDDQTMQTFEKGSFQSGSDSIHSALGTNEDGIELELKDSLSSCNHSGANETRKLANNGESADDALLNQPEALSHSIKIRPMNPKIPDSNKTETGTRCCTWPFSSRSITKAFKHDLSILKSKYCLAIAFPNVAISMSLALTSIAFPDITVGLGYSLAQGAMLISIIASTDIASRFISGFILDANILSLGFTYGIPMVFIGLSLITIGIIEKTASYASLAAISALYGSVHGMTILHTSLAATKYLGSNSVSTVMSFCAVLSIVPLFSLTPLIDYFLKNYGQFANVLYINAIIYILAAIFWLVTAVKETIIHCRSKRVSQV